MPVATPLVQRLQRYIDRRGPDECWPWTGCRHYKGYGRIQSQRRSVSAPRALWALVHGPIPAGYCICHTCDNPPCMNMRHWFLGTVGDNYADMRAKGRERKALGERHGLARLTKADVLAIRASDEPERAIAAKHGVALRTIQHVRSRATWRHIP